MLSKIKMVLETLDGVEVHGRDNLDMLLGCILMLEQCATELSSPMMNSENSEEVMDNG